MTNVTPLVSCVVPIYNAEKYLRQGIESLIHQTYANIEVILVDDHSTDASWRICEEYSARYPNVRSFMNPVNTGGPLRGREYGIRESAGEWVTFMDGDDYVGPDYIHNLVTATDDGRYDIAVSNFSRVFPDGRIEPFEWAAYTQTTDERLGEFYNNYLKNDFWTNPADTVGQCLIRASICKQADFSHYPNTIFAEDTLMSLVFTSLSTNGVIYVDCRDFFWRQVEGSGSHGGFSDRADRPAFHAAVAGLFHHETIYARIAAGLPLVSVIIAAYNVEPYLEECLASVREQGYSRIEIIIVNDGSTDTSGDIAARVAADDPRVRIVSQQNKGLNMARAAGAKASGGTYIVFVDGDDRVHPEYVRALYERIVRTGTDIAVGGFVEFEGDPETLVPFHDIDGEIILKDRVGRIAYYLGQIHGSPSVHPVTAWGKMYASAIIKQTDWKMSDYRRHEDNLEQLQWMDAATNGISISFVPLYFYRVNPSSITRVIEDNVGPDGKRMGYFAFLKELYSVTNRFLHDQTFDVMLLRHFSQVNNLQLTNYAATGKLRDADIAAAAENNLFITDELTGLITVKDRLIGDRAAEIATLKSSTSWTATRPLRYTTGIMRRAARRRRKKSE